MQHVLINFLKLSNLHGLITSCMFINFWKFSSQLDFFTIDFWKIPTCMVLLHPARLLIFGNFPANLISLLLISEKFQPAWPYYILHVYQFWEIFQPAWLLHPARLLDRLEYLRCHIPLVLWVLGKSFIFEYCILYYIMSRRATAAIVKQILNE